MKVDLGGVAETLLITLYMRAKDAQSERPKLNDRKAAELIQKIDYDFSKFNTARASYYGVLARAKIMDREARKFIEKYPDCVVVSVGCGFDTRFERVDNGQIRWYNLDLPEVIEKRRLLLPDTPRSISIGKSLLDASWPQDIDGAGRKLLIISEGVLMYLKEKDVKAFLSILTGSFDDFEAQLDLLYKGMVKKAALHDVVKNTSAQFNWGVKDGSEVVKLNPALKQIGYVNFTDEMKHMLPGWMKLFTPIFYLVNNRLGIYTYQKAA